MVALLVVGAAVAGGNYALLTNQLTLADEARLPVLVGAPLLVSLVGMLLLGIGTATAPAALPPPPAEEPAAPPPPPQDPPETAALRLLAALQEDGRLIDFLSEEVAPYSDEQIGTATRAIHESLGKALRDCIALEPVMKGTEGDDVTVPAGFDPAAIRLVGNVAGQPPFKGVLRHAGWRVTGVTLPERRGQDDRVLAPAEVEIG